MSRPFLMFISIIYVHVYRGVSLQENAPFPPPPQRASARDRVGMVGPRTGGWTALSETEQKSFKCPPCCPWRTEPTVGSGASEKNSPRESDQDPGLPPAPLATP